MGSGSAESAATACASMATATTASTATAWLRPVVLEGRHVGLEPLQAEHAPALRDAVADGDIWRLWYTSAPTPDGVDAYVATALAERDAGLALPFVVRDAGGEIVGSTRYCHVEVKHRRLEIGFTWYAARVHRTGLNTEAKFMLLRHAFETLGTIAVEFRTNWFNQRSRTAIARLGAKQDGVLRNHMLMPDGSYRDTVVFSIIASEWPAVHRHLQFLLDR
jgi:RimJ/RimL family protein N-acetyltransferase